MHGHPFLSVVVKQAGKKGESYARPSYIDFRNHFSVLDAASISDLPQPREHGENAFFARVIEHMHNNPNLTFFAKADNIPPWRVDMLSISSSEFEERLFVSFAYSHSHGDGMSGLAFHRTFKVALHDNLGIEDFDTTFDTSGIQSSVLPVLPHLPISMPYLLAPALGHYLPAFLARALGVKASVSGVDADTWTGSPTFVDSNVANGPIRTAIEILSIDDQHLSAILRACRRYKAKLTALLNEIIARCISQLLVSIGQIDLESANFVSQTPTNLRKTLGMDEGIPGVIGVLASAAYSSHGIPAGSSIDAGVLIGDDFWSAVTKETTHLARATSTLQDQPIGLLSWISDINAWMKDQIGHKRDSSWQLSNLMSFKNESRLWLRPTGDNYAEVSIEKMFFCQPADAVGLPLDFNTVSVEGGDLVVCIGWQPGAFGLESSGGDIEENERKFVRTLCGTMRKYLVEIARSTS